VASPTPAVAVTRDGASGRVSLVVTIGDNDDGSDVPYLLCFG
jgi:hypothetical protein